MKRASETKRSTKLGSSVASASDAAVAAAAVSGKYGRRRLDGPDCGCGSSLGGGIAAAGIGSGGTGGMVCGARHARAFGALEYVDTGMCTAGSAIKGAVTEGTEGREHGGTDMDGMDGGDATGIGLDSSGVAAASVRTALLRTTGGVGNGGVRTGGGVGSGGDDPALSSPPSPHWLGGLLRGGGTRRHWRMCAAKSACASSPPSAMKRFCGWQRYGLWSP